MPDVLSELEQAADRLRGEPVDRPPFVVIEGFRRERRRRRRVVAAEVAAGFLVMVVVASGLAVAAGTGRFGGGDVANVGAPSNQEQVDVDGLRNPGSVTLFLTHTKVPPSGGVVGLTVADNGDSPSATYGLSVAVDALDATGAWQPAGYLDTTPLTSGAPAPRPAALLPSPPPVRDVGIAVAAHTSGGAELLGLPPLAPGVYRVRKGDLWRAFRVEAGRVDADPLVDLDTASPVILGCQSLVVVRLPGTVACGPLATVAPQTRDPRELRVLIVPDGAGIGVEHRNADGAWEPAGPGVSTAVTTGTTPYLSYSPAAQVTLPAGAAEGEYRVSWPADGNGSISGSFWVDRTP